MPEPHPTTTRRQVLSALKPARISEEIQPATRVQPSAGDELVSSEFKVGGAIRAQSVKVYLDTARVPGWNEIDAVQIIGRDGSKQWASASSASSSYADP